MKWSYLFEVCVNTVISVALMSQLQKAGYPLILQLSGKMDYRQQTLDLDIKCVVF